MNKFIHVIIPRINKYNIVYISGLVVTLICLLFDTTRWPISHAIHVGLKCFAGCLLCVILFTSLPKYGVKSIWVIFCVCILTYIGIVTDTSFRMLALTALIFGSKGLNFNNILKVYFCISALFFITTVGASLCGIIENRAIYSWDLNRLSYSSSSVRFCYGYGWPTSMPVHCSIILLTYWYLKNGILSKLDLGVFFAIIYWMILHTDARLGVGSILGILLINIFYFLTRKTFPQYNKLYFILLYSIPFFFILALWATVAYRYNNFTWDFINYMLSGRLALGNEAIHNYGIPLLGQLVKLNGGDDSGIYYNYIDSSYIQLIVIYGIVYTALFLITYYFICHKAYKNNNYPLILAVLLTGVSGLISDYMLILTMNPFYIALFTKTNSNYNNCNL